MLRKNLGPVTMMGFARYKKKENIDTADLISAVRDWQLSFLDTQKGIAMHCFLGNLKGEFADAVMAIDEASFAEMSKHHSDAPSSKVFMEMIDMESLILTPNILLADNVEVPTDFSCIEFRTFKPNSEIQFSETTMLNASARIESEYLAQFKETRAHIIGKIDADTYSEISFVETEGAAREICSGYMGNPICEELLAMFDPKTVDLDFWHVLA